MPLDPVIKENARNLDTVGDRVVAALEELYNSEIDPTTSDRVDGLDVALTDAATLINELKSAYNDAVALINELQTNFDLLLAKLDAEDLGDDDYAETLATTEDPAAQAESDDVEYPVEE